MRLNKYFGPSTMIAAAFIGPGTLTLCTIAGYRYGYDLLWVLLFSVITTLVLQEMSARLGWKTRSGLAEVVHTQVSNKMLKFVLIFIIISAIIIGNAAYEAGNISGGVLGMQQLLPDRNTLPLIIGILAFMILFIGSQKWLEYLLIVLVLLMSVCFLITSLLLSPNILDLLQGFIPSSMDADQLLIAMGLIGTTVVPYNLFLHASTISKKWDTEADINDIRIENRVSILLGGFISMLIIIVAASTSIQSESTHEVKSAIDLSLQLVPLLGKSASWMVSIGLFAAGLSSAITAPLAAAYAAKGIFGWSGDEKSWSFRSVWILILAIGVVVASLGLNAIAVIQFAQIANGILLPVIAIFLLIVMNNEKVMGSYKNSKWNNVMASIVILISIIIAMRAFNSVFNIWL